MQKQSRPFIGNIGSVVRVNRHERGSSRTQGDHETALRVSKRSAAAGLHGSVDGGLDSVARVQARDSASPASDALAAASLFRSSHSLTDNRPITLPQQATQAAQKGLLADFTTE